VFCEKGYVDNNLISAENNQKLTIHEFLNYKKDVVKQAELVNKLDKKSKMQFLKEFFPNSTYDLGLDSYGTVTPDGIIIIDELPDDMESKLQFAKWEIINNELIITAKNKDWLGYNKLVSDDFYFEVRTIKRGGKESSLMRSEVKSLIIKFKIKLYLPERSKLLEDDEYDNYDYIGHGPATDKIEEYYKKMKWKLSIDY